MFWDASSSFGNSDMIKNVGDYLNGVGSSPAPSTTIHSSAATVAYSSASTASAAPPVSSLSYHPTTLSVVYGTPTSATVSATGAADADAEFALHGQGKAVVLESLTQQYESTLTLVVTQTVLEVVPLGYSENSSGAATNEGAVATGELNTLTVTVYGQAAPTTITTRAHAHRHKKTAYATVTQYTTIYV